MLAGMFKACIIFPADWLHTFSRLGYMSAGTIGAYIIFPADQLHCLQWTRIYVSWHV